VGYKGKIYLSDEGYGHIVRQRAIIEELRAIHPDIGITIQTSRHLNAAMRFIPGAEYIDRFNNILWHKRPNGSPDVAAIREHYAQYGIISEAYIAQEMEGSDEYDFLISDFVYEAFPVGLQKGIPAFGIAHFTWDWFFSKLYPPPLESSLIYRFISMAGQAKRLYFPPFTPGEILNHYKSVAVEVPLILRKEINHKVSNYTDKFRVLIADSGAGILSESIAKALKSVSDLDDFVFFVSEKFQCENRNVHYIPDSDLMVDYVSDMNLVIGRAGFNTISECVGLRTPMLLIGEAMNPEINENILMLKQFHLGSFISLQTFETGLGKYLPDFISHEYAFISRNMADHEIMSNGAEVVASDIMNVLSENKVAMSK
jgi:uncharacterized protein (TIGR00661 family)